MEKTPQREVMDVKGAVNYLDGLVSEWLFRREINAGKIPHFRIGKRILLDRQAIDEWITEQVRKSTEIKQPERLLKRAK